MRCGATSRKIVDFPHRRRPCDLNEKQFGVNEAVARPWRPFRRFIWINPSIKLSFPHHFFPTHLQLHNHPQLVISRVRRAALIIKIIYLIEMQITARCGITIHITLKTFSTNTHHDSFALSFFASRNHWKSMFLLISVLHASTRFNCWVTQINWHCTCLLHGHALAFLSHWRRSWLISPFSMLMSIMCQI